MICYYSKSGDLRDVISVTLFTPFLDMPLLNNLVNQRIVPKIKANNMRQHMILNFNLTINNNILVYKDCVWYFGCKSSFLLAVKVVKKFNYRSIGCWKRI